MRSVTIAAFYRSIVRDLGVFQKSFIRGVSVLFVEELIDFRGVEIARLERTTLF